MQSSPGSAVSIILETKINNQRIDGYSTPFVSKVILPDLSLSPIYPINMIRIDTGIYYHRFVLPSGIAAVGNYLVDVSWTDTENNSFKELYQVVVSPSSGTSFSVSPS